MDIEEVFELARAHHACTARTLICSSCNCAAITLNFAGRGGPFTITPKVCARTGDPFRWTRERYENSRKVLLRTGFIERVEPFGITKSGPRPARYRLTARGIEPIELGVNGGDWRSGGGRWGGSGTTGHVSGSIVFDAQPIQPSAANEP